MLMIHEEGGVYIILWIHELANNKGADQTRQMPHLVCIFVVHIQQQSGFLVTKSHIVLPL